jgi:hypothetical protein
LIRVLASSFELVSSDQSSKQSLSGYKCADDNNSKSLQILKDLSLREFVDEVVVVYRQYAFSLTGVSISGNNTAACQGPDRNFKFHAKDIHLDDLFNEFLRRAK